MMKKKTPAIKKKSGIKKISGNKKKSGIKKKSGNKTKINLTKKQIGAIVAIVVLIISIIVGIILYYTVFKSGDLFSKKEIAECSGWPDTTDGGYRGREGSKDYPHKDKFPYLCSEFNTHGKENAVPLKSDGLIMDKNQIYIQKCNLDNDCGYYKTKGIWKQSCCQIDTKIVRNDKGTEDSDVSGDIHKNTCVPCDEAIVSKSSSNTVRANYDYRYPAYNSPNYRPESVLMGELKPTTIPYDKFDPYNKK